MDRRTFVGAVAGTLVVLPLGVEAQLTGKVTRIGYLAANSVETARHLLAAFRHELREHGWVENQNFIIEVRYAEGKVERLPRSSSN